MERTSFVSIIKSDIISCQTSQGVLLLQAPEVITLLKNSLHAKVFILKSFQLMFQTQDMSVRDTERKFEIKSLSLKIIWDASSFATGNDALLPLKSHLWCSCIARRDGYSKCQCSTALSYTDTIPCLQKLHCNVRSAQVIVWL